MEIMIPRHAFAYTIARRRTKQHHWDRRKIKTTILGWNRKCSGAGRFFFCWYPKAEWMEHVNSCLSVQEYTLDECVI
jgi:hypothetical protein